MMRRNGVPAPVLPMFDAQRQRLRRGSANASATNIQATGKYEAFLTLWQQMVSLLAERRAPEIAEIDEIDPSQLAAHVSRRLAGQQDLTQPSGDRTDLLERVQALKQLRARKPTRLCREAERLATGVVAEKVQQVRAALERASGTAPHRMRDLVDMVRQRLQAISLPETTGEPLFRLENVVRGLAAVLRRQAALPVTTATYVTAQLTERVQTFYAEALEAIGLELTTELLRSEIRNLQALLDELLKQSMQFTRNLDAIRTAVEQKRKQGLYAVDYSQASVILQLVGPTENDFLNGLLTRHQCGDRRELALHFLDTLEARLRERAAALDPTLAETAPLGTLLTRLPADSIADAYETVFENSLGFGQSVFEIIDAHGTDLVATELWSRAEPLCDLRSRDIAAFNVVPSQYTVVRLPLPTGPRDPEIRARLAATFRQLGNCSVLDAGENERDVVSVTRVTLGWPLAIEYGNECLLDHYARSADIGHRPHLVGFVSDTGFGEPLPAYLDLAARRHQP